MSSAVAFALPLFASMLGAVVVAIVALVLLRCAYREATRPAAAIIGDEEGEHQAELKTPTQPVTSSCNNDNWEEILTAPDKAHGWMIARDSDSLRAFTRLFPGKLNFRMCAQHCASLADWVVLVRELDLLPRWLSICDSACELGAASATELWPCATFTFPWYWPLPPLYVLLHIRLHERATGDWVITCTSDETYDRSLLPFDTKSYHEVRLDLVLARISTHGGTEKGRQTSTGEGTAAMGTAAVETTAEAMPAEETVSKKATVVQTTSLDAVVKLSLAKLSFLGPARHAMAHAPAWLLNLVASVVVPFLWGAFLETLDKQVVAPRRRRALYNTSSGSCSTCSLVDPHRTSSPWLERLEADATGLYAMLRGHQSPSKHSGRLSK